MLQVVFDLDGTLFDCSALLVPAFQQAVSAYATAHPDVPLSVPRRDAIVATLGMPTDQIFETLFPRLSRDGALAINQACEAALVRLIQEDKGRLYPGVAEGLKTLASRHRLGIASNGKRAYILAVLTHYQLLPFITVPLRVLDGEHANKTAILGAYQREFTGQTLMVGDRHSDREAAEVNDAPFMACLYGHGGTGELAGVQHVAHHFDAVVTWVNFMAEATGQE